MYHHLNFSAFRILQYEPNFSWQINSISYNPTACFVSSFYTLYSTVEPTLPLLQPCKPLTSYFMPVWAKSTPSHLLTLQDPIVTYQFLHYSPMHKPHQFNQPTHILFSVPHAWSTESNLSWVWLGVWYWKCMGFLGLLCVTNPKALLPRCALNWEHLQTIFPK